mmetsp:Transcript_17558/g.29636  ORF Transcript_17558/g.29636 Transcript_17558/m.29636 type:complete len:86 (-) Transcript_17558:43-300(-)
MRAEGIYPTPETKKGGRKSRSNKEEDDFVLIMIIVGSVLMLAVVIGLFSCKRKKQVRFDDSDMKVDNVAINVDFLDENQKMETGI